MKSPIVTVDMSLCAMHLAAYIEYMGRGWHTNNERIIRLTNCDHCRDCKEQGNKHAWEAYGTWRDAKEAVQ